MGNDSYLTPPKPCTNPWGVEISRNALERLLQDNYTKYIEIPWQRPEIKYNPYEILVDYWNE